MKSVCVVPVYNRPRCLASVIDGLNKCTEITSGEVSITFVVEPSDKLGEVLACIKHAMFPKEVTVNPTRLELGRNLIRCRRLAFDELSADAAFIIEDDFVPNPDYFTVILSALKWAHDQGYPVGIVSSNILCHWDYATKIARAGDCDGKNATPTNYLLTRNAWERIRGLLFEYENRFLIGNSYRHLNTPAIRKWFLEIYGQHGSPRFVGGYPETTQHDYAMWTHACETDDGTFPAGQDACTFISLRCKQVALLALKANRGLFIGSNGHNTTEKWFREFGYDKVRQEQIHGDPTRTEFQLV